MNNDGRQFAPATARNREAILEILKNELPSDGTVLEIASGTGEHGHYFTPHFPGLIWQPTDYLPENLSSISAWQNYESRENFLPPKKLDATSSLWPVEETGYPHPDITAIFNANMIHIAPWNVCVGLFEGAGRVLNAEGLLILYGPYKINGEHTAPSNADFDIWLKNRDPDFGVRDIEAVSEIAEKNGLSHVQSFAMPANNFIQIFKKL
ncbi:MAG: class I SAM-dependent methyltransferase [Sneathiellales bacterium]|nr:class I SAM-dependent methyltransferase [Sneathiellales bacterium]